MDNFEKKKKQKWLFPFNLERTTFKVLLLDTLILKVVFHNKVRLNASRKIQNINDSHFF